MKLREQRTVPELATGVLLGGMKDCGPGKGNWTISIYERQWPQKGFEIQAKHDETGAAVSGREATTLGWARKNASQLATVLRGTMHEYNWKEGHVSV